MARCAACQAEIIWSRTTKGKSMPLDKIPVFGGNVDLDRNLIARVVGSDMAVRRYVSHFVSCPEARAFRSPSHQQQASNHP